MKCWLTIKKEKRKKACLRGEFFFAVVRFSSFFCFFVERKEEGEKVKVVLGEESRKRLVSVVMQLINQQEG